MKENYLFMILLLMIMTSCQTPKNREIIIKGKINGNVPENIEYTVPINNVSFILFEKKVQPDSLGNFIIRMEIEKASIVELSNGHKPYGMLIVEPNKQYNIHIDTENAEQVFRIDDNNKGQKLYNDLYISEADMEVEAMKFFNDTIISKIKLEIDEKEKIELDQFQELLNDKLISEEFFNLVQSDRTYFYKGVLSMIASIKYIINSGRDNNQMDDDIRNMWFEVYETHPVTNPDLLRSPWFYYYVQNYLRYFEFTDTSFSRNAQEELYKQGLLQTHKIENAKEFLSDSVLEYYFAASLSYTSFSKNYEKELISLFNQFKVDYPSSKYLPFLEPEIKSIVAFHDLKDKSFGDGVKFIDTLQNNDSFDGIIEGLKGKKVYIDIWATWCAPCKVEFAHKENLKSLLEKNNVETLYISIDKEERAKQWEDMIKYYNLEGYHIRANEKLTKELTEIIGGRYGIPRYLLIDENGNVVNKMAEPPSRIELLHKQIVEM